MSGLLYSSWPLAYWLNPTANRGLASNLGGIGQPYNWVFIILDIISGLGVCAVAVWLYGSAHPRAHSLTKLAVINYGLFGLFTALDAILPVDCAADQNQCGALINHPLVIWHGLISLTSIACLTFSLMCIWWLVIRLGKKPSWLRYMLKTTLVVWLFFGFLTGILLFLNRSSALSQHVFIIACSLWTGLMPYVIRHEGITSLDRLNKTIKIRRRLARVVKSQFGA